MLEHLDGCGECFAVVAALLTEARLPEPVAERRTAVAWKGPALAAAAVFLVGLGVFLLLRGRDAPSGPAAPRESLEQLAARVRDAELERLAEFRPFAADELTPIAVERGGLPVYAPLGRVAAARPTIDWQGVTGATGYRVTVVDEDGATRLSVEVPAPPLPFPTDRAELAPGPYVVEVKSQGSPSVAGARAFVVVGEDERIRFERAQGAIVAHTTGARGKLLQAHHALRSDWVARALELARQAAAEAPHDADATAFLRYVESRIGLPGR